MAHEFFFSQEKLKNKNKLLEIKKQTKNSEEGLEAETDLPEDKAKRQKQ